MSVPNFIRRRAQREQDAEQIRDYQSSQPVIPAGGPLCKHCGKDQSSHVFHLECDGLNTKFEPAPDVYPIETCEKCVNNYWACACGSSPLGRDESNPPAKCGNKYCKRDFKPIWQVSRRCCHRDYHHLGMRCLHCGQMD